MYKRIFLGDDVASLMVRRDHWKENEKKTKKHGFMYVLEWLVLLKKIYTTLDHDI